MKMGTRIGKRDYKVVGRITKSDLIGANLDEIWPGETYISKNNSNRGGLMTKRQFLI